MKSGSKHLIEAFAKLCKGNMYARLTLTRTPHPNPTLTFTLTLTLRLT